MSRAVARGLAHTLGGSAAVAIVSLLRNVLIARVMGAAAFGLWNLCVVAMRLATESHLGALAAVSVDAPRLRGARREDDVRVLEQRAVTVTVLMALFAGAAAGLMLRLVGGPPLATAATLLAVVIVLQQAFLGDTTVLRARRVFGRIAVGQATFAALYLAGLLLLLPDYYITGVLATGVAALLVAIVVLRARGGAPLPLPRPRHLAGARSVLGEGLPVYLVHVTFAVILQTDRLVVGSVLGNEALGVYGILVLGGTGLLFVPDAFSGVLWPFAGESFGRSEGRASALRELTRRAVRQLGWLLAVLLPASLAAVDVLVALFLPQYAAALPPLRVYMIGLFALAAALPLRNVAMTVGGGRALLVVQLVALGVLAVLQIGAAVTGHGLLGVAAAGAVSLSLLLAMCLRVVVARGILTAGDALRLAARLLGMLGVGLAVDAGLSAVAGPAASIGGAAVRVAVPGALTAATALWLLRQRR